MTNVVFVYFLKYRAGLRSSHWFVFAVVFSVAFTARRQGEDAGWQGVVNIGDNSPVTFANVLTNVGGRYDPLHGLFTAPRSGVSRRKYRFHTARARTYAHTDTHTQIHTHTDTYTHRYIHTHTRTHTHIHTCTQLAYFVYRSFCPKSYLSLTIYSSLLVHVCTCVNVSRKFRTLTHTHTHTHTQRHTHKDTYTNTYTHSHTHTHTLMGTLLTYQ
jgi:hypothetical protein